jgi:uncharacterized SAM-binding protein YcdF (DUF218 family)
LEVLAQLAKSFVPGSISCLVAGVLVGTILLYWRRTVRLGRVWLTVLSALYCALSTPWVSNALQAGLAGGHGQLRDPRGVAPADALVALGNGVVTYAVGPREIHQLTRRSAINVLEVARLYHLLDGPWVIVSGGIPDAESQRRAEGDVMRDALIGLGIPAERILTETASRNTYEQVANVQALLKRQHLGRFVLVTTPVDARRSLALFRKAGLNPIPSVSPVRYGGAAGVNRRPLFSIDALRGSEACAYEYLATAWYWFRGRV